MWQQKEKFLPLPQIKLWSQNPKPVTLLFLINYYNVDVIMG
jgi:hypothetical protein